MAGTTGTLAATGSVTLTVAGGTPKDTLATCQLSGTYGTVTLVFEGSMDGTNFSALVAKAVSSGAWVSGTVSLTDNSTVVYEIPIEGMVKVRARCTAIASGTLAVAINSFAAVGLLQPPSSAGSGTVNSSLFVWPVTMSLIADGDILTNFIPGFAGKILSTQFAVTTKVTTGSKASTLNLEIGTTNVTGGVIALTSANCATLGVVVAGTAVTGANVFTSTDTVSIEAASTTAFSEGAGAVIVTMQATA